MTLEIPMRGYLILYKYANTICKKGSFFWFSRRCPCVFVFSFVVCVVEFSFVVVSEVSFVVFVVESSFVVVVVVVVVVSVVGSSSKSSTGSS